MLKMKDIIAFRRTEDGKDIFLDYHGCSESDIGSIGFDSIEQTGEWVSPYTSTFRQPIVFKKNYEFEANLQFSGFVRGCSSAQASFMDYENMDGEFPTRYYMFLTDLSELIKTIGDVSILDGRFTFTKRGSNYAIKYLGPKTSN